MQKISHRIQEYEYAIETVYDASDGSTDTEELNRVLNARAQNGWRLVSAFTNELGKNSVSFAGMGINSTQDQTVLIFERKNPRQSEIEQEIRKEIPIEESNTIESLVPKSLTFIIKETQTLVAISVYCKTKFELQGIQCDLVIYNLFGDHVTISDVCFYSFSKQADGFHHSDTFPVVIPDKISRGLSHAGIIIKRSIGDNELQITGSNEMELNNISEMRKKIAEAFDPSILMEEIELCRNASEVIEVVRKFADRYPDSELENLIGELKEIASLERVYGNMKRSAVRSISEFLSK